MAKRTARTPKANAIGRWLDLAKGLLEQPTAACKEECPQDYIRQFARARPTLSLCEDPSGNLLIKYSPRGGSRRPPLVMVAHLDHPGFWIEKVSARTVELKFQGGVGAGHAKPGMGVRFFALGHAVAAGIGKLASVREENGRLAGATARISAGVAPAGGFAMWDFPGFSVKDELFVTRCCDDLLGAAAALCVLDEIARIQPKGIELWGLFTRAEEIGFLGTLEAIRHKTIPKNACVLSLECSKAAGIAPQGEGVIVRVGDRASIFDPNLSEALRQAAEKVRKKIPGFKYQRKLMDGGSCEATAFCAHGFRASGLAVPLGNYHNQAQDGKRKSIGPETVTIDDFLHEIRLLVELAQHPELLDESVVAAPPWLAERARAARRELSPKSQRVKIAKRRHAID